MLKGITVAANAREMVKRCCADESLGVRKQNLGTFSGGMKQRFGIAQALLGNPKLIIVDEPTAGLDPERAQSLPQPARARSARTSIVILSTHIVEDVRELCTRMAIVPKAKC